MDDNKKNRPFKYAIALIVIILLLILLLFLKGWIPREKNSKKIDRIASQDPLPPVEVIQAVPDKSPIELVLPISANAWHSTNICAQTTGYLIRYLVDIGDDVQEGELIAQIDTPEVDAELAQAIAELDNSRELYKIAKITSDRWQGLWNKNPQAVTRQEVDQYSANLKASLATVVANEKNVTRLKYLQQFKNIYAPFDGIITQRNVDIGTLVEGNINSPSQELFQIAQTNVIRFFVQVPQNYYRLIKGGMNVEVKVKEFPGKIFKGFVARFSKSLDPLTRTMATEVDVDNQDKILYPGIYATAIFLMPPDTAYYIIPTTAIIIRAGYPHVAVVDNNQIVHLKRVEIGRDYGKYIEITIGLEEGDRVVKIPSDAIVENAKVTITATTKTSELDVKEGPVQ